MKFYFPLFLLAFSASCQPNHKNEIGKTITPIKHEERSDHNKAYFAAGCFWCVEAIFEHVKGVKQVISGYSGGKELNPTYQQVGGGATSHAEAVAIYYDPEIVNFDTLVKVFFGTHDPTTLNRQGPDSGTQYRSIAFYTTEKERKTIQRHIDELERKKVYTKPIVTQVVKFKKFWKAEDYHQDYEKRNPDNDYVQRVSAPRLRRFKEMFPELLKENIRKP